MRLPLADRHVTFRCHAEHVDRLRAVAAEQGVRLSELLREAVEVLVSPGAFEAPPQPPDSRNVTIR